MDLDDALSVLARVPDAPFDLAEVALELAREEYARLDVAGYVSELDGMAREARHYLRGDLAQRVNGLCRYLFHEMGFHGNVRRYYDPRNSYLNQVIDRRTGIPITLSAVAIAVGRRAGLDVDGVGLPGHFIAKAHDGCREILFDPFHGGRLLTPAACEQLVEKVTGKPFRATPDQFTSIPLGPMVFRMLNNLKAAYLRAEDYPRAVRVITRLSLLAPDDAVQLRDLGVILVKAGQPGKAISPLESYLALAAAGDDAEAVRKILNQARGEVAKWN
jgi:regulator of sirC expression with transglutaminase-like and TPR domain